MSQEKLLELQHQMRQNQTELQDYLKELDSWTADVKKKDERLKTSRSQDQGLSRMDNQQLPPIRNSLIGQRKKKKKRAKELGEQASTAESLQSERISGYNFRAWDKYDVDAACAEIDNEDECLKSSESDYETDEEWEEERKKQQAVVLKDQGNQLLKEGRYDEAIECYTQGIECDPTNALLPANRAMALLKQEKYSAAILDCTVAIQLDPDYLKAYMRRGTARSALKLYTEAKEDFRHVLAVEPKNQQAFKQLAGVEKVLNPGSTVSSLDSETGIVKAVYKPAHMRSKKPLRRVAIQVLGESQVTASEPASNSEERQRLTKEHSAGFEQFVSLRVAHEKVTEDKTGSCQNGVQEEARGEPTSEGASRDPPVGSEASPSQDTSMKVPKVPRQVPPAPASSYQFQAEWKSLKNTTEEFYQYFKQIPVANYKLIFGDALDADMLLKIFCTLQHHYVRDDEDILPALQHLCEINRFGITILFFSEADKQNLKSLFKHLRRQHPEQDKMIDKLASVYDV